MLFWKKKPKSKSKPKQKPVTSSPTVPRASKPPPTQRQTPRPRPEIPRMVKKESESKRAFERGNDIAKGLADGISDVVKKQEQLVSRRDSEKEFMLIFKKLTYRHRAWDVWGDFVTMFACAISNAVDKTHYDEREALYMKTIKKYNKQEQQLFPELTAETVMALETNLEQDFLGKMYMTLELGDKAKAQIFTPYHVCDLMARMVVGDVATQVKKDGYITINDPCCGAGATLIAGANEARKQLEKAGLNYQNHVLIAAQDIDETVALMCYIQLSLMGLAAYIKIGNSLTEAMASDDTLENYWFTPIYFSDVWAMRRLFHRRVL